MPSPWEEARGSVVIKTDDGVCKEDSALEEQNHSEDDEEWHGDENTRLLLWPWIVLLHILSGRLWWRRWRWRSDRGEDGGESWRVVLLLMHFEVLVMWLREVAALLLIGLEVSCLGRGPTWLAVVFHVLVELALKVFPEGHG